MDSIIRGTNAIVGVKIKDDDVDFSKLTNLEMYLTQYGNKRSVNSYGERCLYGTR